MDALYTATVTSSGDGRSGVVRSADGLLDLPLTPPKEVGGAGTGANPEMLYAAGHAACFHSAMRAAARERRVPLDADTTVTADVGLVRDGSGYHLTVELLVRLPGLAADTARELAADAHGRCPYSKAVRGNVPVTVVLDGAERLTVAAEPAAVG